MNKQRRERKSRRGVVCAIIKISRGRWSAKKEMSGKKGRRMNVHHITMQHPHPFSSFDCSWAETTGGFQLGLGVNPNGGVSCTLGMVL